MRWLSAVLLLASWAADAQVADSLARAPQSVTLDSLARTPRGAVTRALLLPGLGQVYNRQPVKAPVASALVVGSVVYFVTRQRQYLLYRRAAAYAGCLDVPGSPENRPDRIELCADVLASDLDEYDRVIAERGGAQSTSQLQSLRAMRRSQRDIGGVVVLAAYALQALDAYVSAELADFDVSEDLGMTLSPTPDGPMLGLRVRL